MTFQDLNLNTPLLKALDEIGFKHPTTIQQKAFAPIMSGKDVLGIAQTGTGKTYAYLLPLIRQWVFAKKKVPYIIILVPTRELVLQVVDEFERLAIYTQMKATGAYGGANIKTQMSAILEGVDVVVATPGRLLDLLLNGTINSKHVKKLVIDEMDELLNLGFRTQIKNIFALLPERRQNLMFSATITDEVESLMDENFNHPTRIEAAPTGTPLANITQIGYAVPNFNTKINFLSYLFNTDSTMTKVLIFASSKTLADLINVRLENEFSDRLAVIHSNKTQPARFKTVEDFENGVCSILIATDIIARGLDVSEVSHVINMDVPIIPENYIHRIGRTGRADKKGIAITFIDHYDLEHQEKIEALMGCEIPMQTMPTLVEISDVLLPEEEPTIRLKVPEIRKSEGLSFHEKIDKNKKINIKVTRADKMKEKYGKRYKKEHRD
jgi:ATP-dependent RNA helicase RhlE